MQCQLCGRDVSCLTEHHLVPRQHTKRKKQIPGETIDICSPCHRQIHVLFDNRQLAQELDTIDRLQNHPAMAGFLTWVRKQDPNKRVKIKR
jgi:5-methylcytosine-specific restriction endonuclease McrA